MAEHSFSLGTKWLKRQGGKGGDSDVLGTFSKLETKTDQLYIIAKPTYEPNTNTFQVVLVLIDSFKKCYVTNSLDGTKDDVVGINTDTDDSQSKSDSDEAKC